MSRIYLNTLSGQVLEDAGMELGIQMFIEE